MINHRYNFELLVEAIDSNPNGDPDQDNRPRMDPQTQHGFMTDMSIKRKIRDFVSYTHPDGRAPWGIFISMKTPFNVVQAKAFEENGIKVPDPDKPIALPKGTDKLKMDKAIKATLCKDFFDVRTFGAVLNTFSRAGMVGELRGPVQIDFAHSIDPIMIQQITTTREGITRVSDFDGSNRKNGVGKSLEMGRKYVVPYGLYVIHGSIDPVDAARTGFDKNDLKELWTALELMFIHDHASGRSRMATRRLWVFQHNSWTGNVQDFQLYRLIHIAKKQGVDYPRKFDDYTITTSFDKLPKGVTVRQLVQA